MTDEEEGLGWNDPVVIIGAVALVVVNAWIVAGLVSGHWSLRSDDHPNITRTSSQPTPSGSAVLTSAYREGLPCRSCGYAARDGSYNIHIDDPAYDPALDRNRDGIACER